MSRVAKKCEIWFTRAMATESLIHDFNSQNVPNSSLGKAKTPVILFIVLAFLGLGTGYILASARGSNVNTVGSKEEISKVGVNKGEVFGSKDEKTFKDNAEGVLKEGGIDGEGEYHLERTGGDSQNVYMTSSVIDLSPFVNKKVKVWGETHAAEKAGWLMDVGRLEVL